MGLNKHSSDQGTETFLAKLDRGYVDCNRHRRKAFLLSLSGLATSGSEHPLTDRQNQSAVLSHSYELVRRHKSQLRMLPADQRFKSRDFAAGNVHLRLIHQEEFIVLKR